MTDYLDTLGIPIAEFYAEVREVQEESADPYLKQFVKCLLASADYDSFYRVMSREGKAYKLKRQSEERRSAKGEPLEDDSSLSPNKAEAKVSSSAREDDDVKGSGSVKLESDGESAKEVGSSPSREYK